MEYKQLGNTELKLSEISFGCMSLAAGSTEDVKLLHQALDKGINFFDTADLYQHGENERTVGKAFSGMRDKVIISTKVGNQWRHDGSGWDWNPTKSYILKAVEASLQRLQTDYIDLYQLHGGTIDDPIDETIEAFELLKQQGKIRHYGISSIRPNVIREYVQRSSMASVMLQYSLLDRRPEENVLGLLLEQNIGVLARGSMAQGLLAGKPAKPYLGYSQEQIQQAADEVKAVAGTKRKPSEVAVKFALAHPAITTAVLGIRTEAQLADAIHTGHTPPLQQEELDKLQHVLPLHVFEQHR